MLFPACVQNFKENKSLFINFINHEGSFIQVPPRVSISYTRTLNCTCQERKKKMSFLSRSAIVEILDFGKGNLKIRNNRLRNKRRTGSRVRRREKKKDKKDRHTAAGITLCDRRPLAKILIASVAVLHNFVMHPVKRNTIVSFARRENARGCFAPLSVHRLRLRKPDRLELSAKFI